MISPSDFPPFRAELEDMASHHRFFSISPFNPSLFTKTKPHQSFATDGALFFPKLFSHKQNNEYVKKY
jgi:hypothetical protein